MPMCGKSLANKENTLASSSIPNQGLKEPKFLHVLAL